MGTHIVSLDRVCGMHRDALVDRVAGRRERFVHLPPIFDVLLDSLCVDPRRADLARAINGRPPLSFVFLLNGDSGHPSGTLGDSVDEPLPTMGMDLEDDGFRRA